MKEHIDPIALTIRVTSPAFGMNGMIPIEFTADGEDIPPPLAWTGIPDGTRSIVVTCEDPDAPSRTYTHWIVVGIPPTETGLDASMLPPGAVFGLNDRGEVGWTGPNPPSGRHRYFFNVFALDINLARGTLNKQELYAAMKGHIVARGELVGTYEKVSQRRPATPPSSGSHPRRH